MALVLKDRVKETSTTTGTGTFTLAGAASGFQSFSVIGDGNTTYYAIVNPSNGDWEVGLGTYASSGTTLARTEILDSSNSGSAVDFGAGNKDVFVTYPASAASKQTLTKYKYVATAGQTTFSGSDANALTLSYTVGSIIVTLNGVVMDAADYTATTGNSVVLGTAAALNDELGVFAFSTFDIANTYTQAEVDSFAVKLTGDQTVAGVKTFSSQPVMSAGVSLGSNGQIKFPATQNASSDANTLDDYEEGTFTPTFVATGCTFNYAYQAGAYTKVGRTVTLMIAVALAGSGNSLNTSQLRIGGMPFPILAGSLYWHSASVGAWAALSTSVYNILANSNNGSQQIDLNKVTAATGGPAAMLANDLSATGGSSIVVAITYQTS